jgi:AraC-like DNA-binding protein
MLRRSAENKLPFSHTCHGGLCDTSVPILKNGTVAGYIVIGRVRKEELPSEEVIENICSYGIKKEDILSAFPTATHLSDSQLDSLIRLISHILFENAIDIDYGEFINRATEYIDENLQGSLTINDLCRELFVSKNMLYESFESYFCKTPNEYITDKRIEAAKALLKSKGVSVTGAAESVGIYNYTYFSKLFKKKTGMTPREYKKLPHGK